jgi:hypothetical protein
LFLTCLNLDCLYDEMEQGSYIYLYQEWGYYYIYSGECSMGYFNLFGYLGLDFYASWGYILLLLSSMDYGKYLDTTCYNLLDKTCLNLDCLYGEMEQKS